jgi:hypothetical protein
LFAMLSIDVPQLTDFAGLQRPSQYKSTSKL